MRVAKTRLGVLDACDAARQGVGRTWSHFMLPRSVMRMGAIAGGGVLGVWIFRRMLSRPVPALPCAAAAAPEPAAGRRSALGYVALQLFSVVLLPWLRRCVVGGELGEALKRRWEPSRLFFRWLGLEK
ncbi:MAG: hypothetical protein J1E42_01655 [Akkermansiaceae bacterium]|nr:hypothetical protein [Akkermansiaceae bacterium]